MKLPKYIYLLANIKITIFLGLILLKANESFFFQRHFKNKNLSSKIKLQDVIVVWITCKLVRKI